MTIPNTPAYVPTGLGPQVAWDPDDHIYKVSAAVSGQVGPVARMVQGAGGTQTTSGTFADIVDMVDNTVLGGPGTLAIDLLVIFTISMVHSAINTNSTVGIKLDAASPAGQVTSVATVANSGGFFCTTAVLFPNVAPGAHTVKAQWLTAGGTLFGNSSQRWLTVVEFRK
jgi:hypothetical protein